jgi:glutaredoxin
MNARPPGLSTNDRASDSPSRPLPVLTVYTAPGCHLCEDALAALGRLQAELGFVVDERDITSDESLHRAYFERIPVVAIDGEELCEYVVDETLLRERLESRR